MVYSIPLNGQDKNSAYNAVFSSELMCRMHPEG